jgi:hypothetical protein
VMQNQSEPRPATRSDVFEHPKITVGVAESQDRSLADELVNGDRAQTALLDLTDE